MRVIGRIVFVVSPTPLFFLFFQGCGVAPGTFICSSIVGPYCKSTALPYPPIADSHYLLFIYCSLGERVGAGEYVGEGSSGEVRQGFDTGWRVSRPPAPFDDMW